MIGRLMPGAIWRVSPFAVFLLQTAEEAADTFAADAGGVLACILLIRELSATAAAARKSGLQQFFGLSISVGDNLGKFDRTGGDISSRPGLQAGFGGARSQCGTLAAGDRQCMASHPLRLIDRLEPSDMLCAATQRRNCCQDGVAVPSPWGGHHAEPSPTRHTMLGAERCAAAEPAETRWRVLPGDALLQWLGDGQLMHCCGLPEATWCKAFRRVAAGYQES